MSKNFKNRETSNIGKLQLDTVNFLNRQEFMIDKNMLDYLIENYYDSESILFDGLNEIHQNTKIFNSIENDNIKKKIMAHNSKVHLYQQILAVAIIFQNNKFYIPTFLDFRGRIYTSVEYLSYQASDLSRSLILFFNGCKIENNNIRYVLQYLANLSGKSKLTLENKEK
jgi:hypothetical protein